MGNRVKLQAAAMYKGPSINDVGNFGAEGSKIGQNCRLIVLKICQNGGGGCQKSGKIADVVYGWPLMYMGVIFIAALIM